MEELLIKSMLLGLVAGLRPILIPVLLGILANQVHARPRGLALIGGAAAGMAVQCLVAWLVSDALPRLEIGSEHERLATLAAVFGLMLALLGVALLVFRPKIRIPERFAKQVDEAGEAPRLGPIAVFAFFKTVFNSRIFIVTLAMAASLAAVPPGSAGTAAAIIVFFICSMSFLGLIMAYYLLRPEAAGIRLDRLSQWSMLHGTQVLGVMALLIGGGLFLNGMSALR